MGRMVNGSSQRESTIYLKQETIDLCTEDLHISFEVVDFQTFSKQLHHVLNVFCSKQMWVSKGAMSISKQWETLIFGSEKNDFDFWMHL
jgi:hypothetical protein